MRKRDSSFVSAKAERPTWFEFLFGWLRKERVCRGSTESVQIRTEVPSYIYSFRDQVKPAKILLRRYVEGKSTTRRAWMSDGYSDNSWRLARRILKNAGVLNRKSELLYTGRDALHRLNVYLDQIEDKCWQSYRYVSP